MVSGSCRYRSRYSQFPPSGIDRDDDSPEHRSVHVASEQLTEQEPVHRMSHTDPPLQATLPLAPTDSEQDVLAAS